MSEASLPLTAYSEAQRAQTLERFMIIRPALEKEITQAQVARTHHLPPSTVQLWINQTVPREGTSRTGKSNALG
ncbi:MAG TPA: helix-turn-helix domain-containing protein [Ktedonobacteraceae bacterium]|nr:helix-turn-helix domain-containing protein [Ktedonobacteraceae bacterium]